MSTHNEFKLFTAKYNNGKGLKPLLNKIMKWSGSQNIEARSIGVEYLEGKDMLLMSLGFVLSNKPHPITLKSVKMGVLDLDDLDGMNLKMSHQAEDEEGVICHELFVTGDDSLTLIFML